MISQVLSHTPMGIFPMISLGIFLSVWILAVGWTFRRKGLAREYAQFSQVALTDDRINSLASKGIPQ